MTGDELRDKTEDMRERLWSETASACRKSDRQLLLDISRFLGDQNEEVLSAVFEKLAEVGGRPLYMCSLLLLSAIAEVAIRNMPEDSRPKEEHQQ